VIVSLFVCPSTFSRTDILFRPLQGIAGVCERRLSTPDAIPDYSISEKVSRRRLPDDESVDIILLSRVGILIDLLKFPQFFNELMHFRENGESEKPDGLRFVRGAQFERFGSGLITPGLRVLTLYKGAWRKKGTLAGASR
jgi:hypothetical protein